MGEEERGLEVPFVRALARAGKGSLQLHRALALTALGVGSSLPPRVLEAWAQSAAQGRVQRVAITQFQQVGHRHLLRTHWAQWRTALLQVWPEPRAKAPETSTAHPGPSADLRQWPRLASRGCLLVLMDTVAPWEQVRWGPGGIGDPKMTRGPGP